MKDLNKLKCDIHTKLLLCIIGACLIVNFMFTIGLILSYLLY